MSVHAHLRSMRSSLGMRRTNCPSPRQSHSRIKLPTTHVSVGGWLNPTAFGRSDRCAVPCTASRGGSAAVEPLLGSGSPLREVKPFSG